MPLIIYLTLLFLQQMATTTVIGNEIWCHGAECIWHQTTATCIYAD